jgi:hypothetical protein
VYLVKGARGRRLGSKRKKTIYANLLMQCKLRHVWIAHGADSADIEQNIEEEKEIPPIVHPIQVPKILIIQTPKKG